MGRKAPSAVVFSMKSADLALEAELEFQLSAQGIEALADIAGSDIAEALVVAQLGGQADCLAEPIACACGRIESPVEFDFVGAAAEGLATTSSSARRTGTISSTRIASSCLPPPPATPT